MIPWVAAVRLGRLGDLVMCAPALRWLSGRGDLKVTLHTDAHWLPLAACLPGLRLVEGSVGEHAASVVFDMHGVPRSRPVVSALRSRGGLVVATAKERIRRRLLLLTPPAAWPHVGPRRTWPRRHLDGAIEVVRRLGLPVGEIPSPTPVLTPPPAASRPGPVLGLQVGASTQVKALPVPRARTLALRWRERTGGTVIVLGAEAPLVDAVVAGGLAERWEDPSLSGLITAVASCDAVVGGDTGPVHLAGAFGKRVVLLFGPTPERAGFAVWGPDSVARPTISCAPCSMHGPRRCPRGHGRCMEEHDTDWILDTLLRGNTGCMSPS